MTYFKNMMCFNFITDSNGCNINYKVLKPHVRRNLIRELNSTKHTSFYNCKKNVSVS